jgi:hypothetical protein
MKFFGTVGRYTLFDHQLNKEISKELEVETVGRETKKIQIRLVTTCEKNEQKQDPKNNDYYL